MSAADDRSGDAVESCDENGGLGVGAAALVAGASTEVSDTK